MTDSPLSIAALIASLEAAQHSLEAATSFRQRKARNQVVINRGLALHERLGELRVWLSEHDDEKHEEKFLANLEKYRLGWDALNAAAGVTMEYKRLHFTEDLTHTPSPGSPGKARPIEEASSPSPYKHAKEEQAVML